MIALDWAFFEINVAYHKAVAGFGIFDAAVANARANDVLWYAAGYIPQEADARASGDGEFR